MTVLRDFLQQSPIALLFVALAAIAGCRCPACKCVPPTPVAPCSFQQTMPAEGSVDLAALVPACGEPGGIEPSPCDFPCLLPGPTECYETLDATTCQCNAATNTSIANAVALERHWANVLISCEEGLVEEALCLTRSLLALQAADLRNASAATALTSFYLLAGVEAQQDYLDRGISELETAIRRLDSLKEEGLPTPDQIDRSVLATQLVELRDKNLQLCLLRIQLNGQLKRQLGCPLDERRFFWPRVEWAPNLAPIDIESAVAEGLSSRVDLRSLQLVRCKLSKATVPVARLVLQVADGTLGAVTPTPGLIHHLRCADCKKHEIDVRCRQLLLLEEDATQLAIAKVKNGAYKVMTQQDRVRLAKQAVDERRAELNRLEKIREVEDISIFEISAARGRLFEAEATLVEKVIELKVAEVALRETQGMLAVECGYSVSICGEHCCTGECGCRPCRTSSACSGSACSRSACSGSACGCGGASQPGCGLSVCGDAVSD